MDCPDSNFKTIPLDTHTYLHTVVEGRENTCPPYDHTSETKMYIYEQALFVAFHSQVYADAL